MPFLMPEVKAAEDVASLPIERVIGWKPGMTDCGHGWHTPDDREVLRAEVDDLLAGMTSWYPGLDIEIYQDGKTVFDGWNVIVSLTDYSGAEAWNVNASGETLLNTLTAAVRGVAEVAS